MNFEKKDKEGMLIDLTSPQSQDVPAAVSNGSFALNLNGMSILDAPIDVPTEYPNSELSSIELFTSITDNSSKLEPPPYQSPPTYMNTYGLSQTPLNYGAGPSSMEHSQYRNLDPFDTSHIGSSQKSQRNAYSSGLSSPSHSYQISELTKLDGNFIQNQTDGIEGSSIAIARPKSAAVAQIDEMVQNKIAQLSPKSSLKYSSTKAYVDSTELKFSIDNNISIKNSTSNDTSLNDSLKVNLSSLTLNDTSELESESVIPSKSDDHPKLDRAFLAELEKTIYKNDISVANVNVNISQPNEFQQTNAKDNTVRSIPSKMYGQASMNWLQNGITSNGSSTSSSSAAAGASSSSSVNSYQSIGTNSIHSPAKYKNNDTTIKMTNYETTASINAQPMTLSKKLYNTEISSIDYSAITTNVNQINSNYANASNNQQQLYSNYTMTNALINNIPSNGTMHESKQHNFVAQSNQKLPSVTNVYNTVNSDIYGGSMAGASGNVYDIVASSNNDAYYQMIQPSNELQTVIYDEVAGDEMRPHRPAPGPPPTGTILSAQQIQRRIERAQKGQPQQKQQQLYGNLNGSTYANSSYAIANHSTYEEIQNPNSQQEIYSFIKELNDDATEQEAKDALNAANWDHNQAVRHFKIERLMRLTD